MCLQHDDIDVFCIAETWLNDDFDNEMQNDRYLSWYNVFWVDRFNDMEHGGFVCYIKNGISCKQISVLDDIVEAMWLEVAPNKPILAVYRPPESKAEYLSLIFYSKNVLISLMI